MPLAFYLGLSAFMFVVGIIGVLIRRNAIVVFMSLELMFNAANLLFMAFASYYQILSGQIYVIFVMGVAAAEVAVGLALMVTIFRAKHSIDVDQLNIMKG